MARACVTKVPGKNGNGAKPGKTIVREVAKPPAREESPAPSKEGEEADGDECGPPGGKLSGRVVEGCPSASLGGDGGSIEWDVVAGERSGPKADDGGAGRGKAAETWVPPGTSAGPGAPSGKGAGAKTEPPAAAPAAGGGETAVGVRRALPAPKGVQPPLDLYVTSQHIEKIDNIFPGDARRVLDAIRSHLEGSQMSAEGGPRAFLLFDNDLDGFSSAVYLHQMLWDMGIEIAERDIVPMTHLELASMTPDPGALYFYVDIQPNYFDDRTFCVDHHVFEGKNRHVTEQAFIFAPEDIERHFPTTALMLVLYLDYVYRGGNLDFISYVMDRLWDREEFTRRMVLLDSVSDNLWMLSRHSKVGLLRTWIKDTSLDETELIKVSIAASLIIGELDGNIRGLERFFDTPFHLLGVKDIQECFDRVRADVDNLFEFAMDLHRISDRVVESRNSELDDELAACNKRLELDTESLDQLLRSMPVHVKRDMETQLDMLRTVGDRSNPRWKQVEFYATEVPRLTKVIEGNRRRLELLREKKRMVFPEVINGMCVFITKQRSAQVKGILSSLLYYLGRRNLIIEEGDHAAVWGARGFSKDFLEAELTTLQVDRHALGIQSNLDDLAKFVPHSFKHVLNITKNITIQRQYIGGMGGRGLIFGGNIKGRVPKIFATLDDDVMQKKVAELVEKGEFAKAVRGLTEGQDLVSTAQALRSKFKARGWITFQAIGTGGTGDILAGDVGSPLVWLAGRGKQVGLNGNGPRLLS